MQWGGGCKSGSRVILEQIVARGGERSRNVRTTVRGITYNDTVADLHLTALFGARIIDHNVSSTRSSIAVDSSKSEFGLRRRTRLAAETCDFDAADTVWSRGRNRKFQLR